MKTIFTFLIVITFVLTFIHKGISKEISSRDSIIFKDYTEVDNFALKIKMRFTDINDLADTLTKTFSKEEDKVRAIYRWMTNNISYDCKDFHNNCYQANKIFHKKRKEYLDFKYEYANVVLQSKKGICEGYAALFYELCKTAKINCMIQEGFVDSNIKLINFLRKIIMYNSNHAWNKVKINQEWYYIDVTWSSGSTNCMVTKFTKIFNSNYFLSPINKAYPTHLPTMAY